MAIAGNGYVTVSVDVAEPLPASKELKFSVLKSGESTVFRAAPPSRTGERLRVPGAPTESVRQLTDTATIMTQRNPAADLWLLFTASSRWGRELAPCGKNLPAQ